MDVKLRRDLASNYRWEATMADGSVITKGGDLTAAHKVSLIPQRAGLPAHDIAGVPLVKRFCRGVLDAPLTHEGASAAGNEISRYAFIKRISVYSELHHALWANVCKKHNLPGDVVARLIARVCRVYGNNPNKLLVFPDQQSGGELREYLHCICAKSFRLWVRSSDGTSLITPPDYDKVMP